MKDFFDRLPRWVQLVLVILGYFIYLTPVTLALVVASPFLAFVGAFATVDTCECRR